MEKTKKIDKGIIIEPGNYTVITLLDSLRKEFKTKVNGNKFTNNDVYQYILKGFIPHTYGGNIVESDGNIYSVSITVTGKRKPHIIK